MEVDEHYLCEMMAVITHRQAGMKWQECESLPLNPFIILFERGKDLDSTYIRIILISRPYDALNNHRDPW